MTLKKRGMMTILISTFFFLSLRAPLDSCFKNNAKTNGKSNITTYDHGETFINKCLRCKCEVRMCNIKNACTNF